MDLIKSEEFTKHVHGLLEEWHVTGVAVAIVHNDKFESRGYGKASLEPERPVTADTIFDIASCSKSITAASVALLVNDDEKYPNVQWDSKMSELLPDDFVMSGEGYTENVTLEDILSHRTGLPGHDQSYLSSRAETPDTIQSVTRNIRNLPILAPIRSKYMYCNMMYTVATYLVEKLSGMTFPEFAHKHLFEPMGMSSTFIQPSAVIDAGLEDRLAKQYIHTDDGTFKQTPFEQSPESQGAGSVMTSVNDYIKYIRCMINHEGPITEDLVKGVTKPRTIPFPEDGIDDLDPFTSLILYAAGWEVRWYRGHKVIQHDGSISGIGTIHFFMPDLKFGAALFANSDDGGIVADNLAMTLMDEVIGVPKSERADWTAVVKKRLAKWKEEKKSENEGDALKKKIWPDYDGTCQPQEVPLKSYTGKYWNAGYHGLEVEIKDEKLFVSGGDRTMPFSLTFEHVSNQTEYVVHMNEWWVPTKEIASEFEGAFRFENDRVMKMGIMFEEDLEEMIWFDRVE